MNAVSNNESQTIKDSNNLNKNAITLSSLAMQSLLNEQKIMQSSINEIMRPLSSLAMQSLLNEQKIMQSSINEIMRPLSSLAMQPLLKEQKIMQSSINEIMKPLASLTINSIINQQELLRTKVNEIIKPLSSITMNSMIQFQKQFQAEIEKIKIPKIKENLLILENSQEKLFNSLSDISDLNISPLFLNNIININSIKKAALDVYDENKINKLNKSLEYASISNDINSARLEDIKKIASKSKDLKELENCSIVEELMPVERIIPNFISYAYSSKSNDTLFDAYDKSNIKKIIDNANLITYYIEKINLITYERERINVFDWNQEVYQLAINIKNIVQNEEGFKQLANILFKGIYESSGVSNNRLFLLLEHYKLEEFTIITTIKSFRNLNFHKLGEERKKLERTIEYFMNSLQKRFPSRPTDWIRIQLQIYVDIANMLKTIYDKLNNDLSNDLLNLLEKQNN